jgi:histidinol dehydrogenase
VVNPVVLAAAQIAGVNQIYKIGGAQAIGAMAYGTETITKVDKIVGPGNAYVAAAKKKVFGTVGIDMIAGPSEILIICDGKTDPDWIVMDLFSQAEHDELAQSILVSNDESFLDLIQERVAALLPQMPRKSVIQKSLEDRGAMILVDSLEKACEIANRIAPEHLELSVEEPDSLLDQIENAGAIFIGKYTSEALGDYCAGPNHVLPTSGTSRFSSPLGVYDFQKRTSLIEVSKSGARDLGLIAAKLAREEGLEAHARSAEKRFKS